MPAGVGPSGPSGPSGPLREFCFQMDLDLELELELCMCMCIQTHQNSLNSLKEHQLHLNGVPPSVGPS